MRKEGEVYCLGLSKDDQGGAVNARPARFRNNDMDSGTPIMPRGATCPSQNDGWGYGTRYASIGSRTRAWDWDEDCTAV
jgi:hypothetical protein